MFRGLKPSEIDVRVGQVGSKGVSLLLYKDARVDMAILDETFGMFGWQRDHKEIKGRMYCGVGVMTPDNEWIWKWDCGVESNTEAEKGESSDSFKRACTNWGIGRELYESPFIFLTVATNPRPNGKGYEMNNPYELKGLHVSNIEYKETDNKRIITALELSIGNQVVWTYGDTKKKAKKPERPSDVEKDYLKELCKQKNYTLSKLLADVGVKGNMTYAQYEQAIKILEG